MGNQSELCDQACAVRSETPDLYDFFVRKDDAVEQAIRMLASAIPNPLDIPDFGLSFRELVQQVLKPGTDDECAHWLDGNLLGGKALGERMYQICRNGVYLRTVRLDSIAGPLAGLRDASPTVGRGTHGGAS